MLEYSEFKSFDREPSSLAIFLHGYGSNKDDLITLAPDFSKFLPNTVFISPNAPEKLKGVYGAHQWFSLANRQEAVMLQGANSASKILDEFIDAQLARFNLPPKKLILIGFSQGTMVALHTALRRKKAPKALLCYSGALLSPDLLKNEISCEPEVMLIHGSEDNIVSVEAATIAEEELTKHGVNVKKIIRPKLAHGIDEYGVNAGGEFLRNALLDI